MAEFTIVCDRCGNSFSAEDVYTIDGMRILSELNESTKHGIVCPFCHEVIYQSLSQMRSPKIPQKSTDFASESQASEISVNQVKNQKDALVAIPLVAMNLLYVLTYVGIVSETSFTVILSLASVMPLISSFGLKNLWLKIALILTTVVLLIACFTS